MTVSKFYFQKAVPVWEEGQENAMNYTLEFKTQLQGKDDYVLYLAGATSYLVFVNDRFLAHGPARAAHGFYKVDRLLLEDYLSEGENQIKIRCSGYNVNSFSYIEAPSFLCAEIRLGEKVVRATGYDFKAFTYPQKIRKTQRYSYQRTFAESYFLGGEKGTPITLIQTEEKQFLERDVPYCEYGHLFPVSAFRCGVFTTSDKQQYYHGREIANISEDYKGFLEDELECGTHVEYGKLDFSVPIACNRNTQVLELSANEYIDMDMGVNQTGLLSMEIEADSCGTLILAFDEMLQENELNPFRNSSSNVIILKLEAGRHQFVSAEPYGFRYARLAAKDTGLTIRNFSLREIAFSENEIVTTFQGNDDVMRRIFDAAKLSFRANVTDIYMDCSTRERAGWLCDSFFIARVEKLLTGKSVVERSYLETFLLPEVFSESIPKEILPMCYPCDVINSEFIPNWAMWYGLELYEYYQRTKDDELIEEARPRMMSLLAYFKKFENPQGLLEHLEGVVFVDASGANGLANAHDISFPTNMLYTAFQSVLGILYEDEKLVEQARKLRRTIGKLALMENGFYRDTADVTPDGLELRDDCSEACQYYAFFFKLTTPEESPWLWNTMLRHFSYEKNESKEYQEIYPANTFIGKYLRLELIAQYGSESQLYDNIRGYFSGMADITGTLWEYIGPTASCNHGYASYVIYWMDRLRLLDKKE